jgi:uncharacterized protein YyaL (SSP411 family)
MKNQSLDAALRLHHYLSKTHWNGQGLFGPDPGIRFNYRIGRFIKGYLSVVPWRDDLYYLQGQGYWILANWRLYEQTRMPHYRALALECGAYIMQRQRSDGAWAYPNREWQGRVATMEGTWGALGLLECFRQTSDTAYLAGVWRWHDYLFSQIGFQRKGDEVAVNYFATDNKTRVPNNSCVMLRYLAEVAAVTGETSQLALADGLLRFISNVQLPSGELPYTVARVENPLPARTHFQCYQYNAFQCLDLLRYFELTGDDRVLPLVEKIVGYLQGGVGEDGRLYYQCGNRHRAVTYHAAAAGAALLQAERFGLPVERGLAQRAYDYVYRQQRSDGSVLYSRSDYGLFSDLRSYPRYLAMILYHLLISGLAETSALNQLGSERFV